MKNYTIHQSSRWSLPPTARQCSALAKYGVKEEDMPDTRWYARDMIYKLRQQANANKV